jgi:hypothetical protein
VSCVAFAVPVPCVCVCGFHGSGVQSAELRAAWGRVESLEHQLRHGRQSTRLASPASDDLNTTDCSAHTLAMSPRAETPPLKHLSLHDPHSKASAPVVVGRPPSRHSGEMKAAPFVDVDVILEEPEQKDLQRRHTFTSGLMAILKPITSVVRAAAGTGHDFSRPHRVLQV